MRHVHLWLEDDRVNVGIPDVLDGVGSLLVVHDVPIRNVGLHRFVAHIDGTLPPLMKYTVSTGWECWVSL